MSKLKTITGLGIFAGGVALSGAPQQNIAQTGNGTAPTAKEIIAPEGSSPAETYRSAAAPTAVKRTAAKVYHRFEQIPAISDAEAALYNKNEYAYIVNADTYQKSGRLELKRVLKEELTKANALSLVYRSECQTYEPQKDEDQLAKYVIDLRIMSKTGITKGPSQMDDNAIKSFIKYLAANPETRQYVLPLLKSSGRPVEEVARQLEHKFFDSNGDLRPMDERDAVLHGRSYADLKLKHDAWQEIASPELKSFIAKEESRMSKKAAQTIKLSSTTKNYLCLTELFPSEELLKRQIEDYNLAFYQLGRPGKTKHVMAALARSMNLKDNAGNLNATRIPPFAIAAAISSINWKGNGKDALKDAQNLRSTLQKTQNSPNALLRVTAKKWVTGKSKRYGVDEMYDLNIITPDLIRQYKELELPGAKDFSREYHKAVEMAESKARIAAHGSTRSDDTAQAAVSAKEETPQKNGKTLLLTALDFVRGC